MPQLIKPALRNAQRGVGWIAIRLSER